MDAKPLYLAKPRGEDRKIRELVTSEAWNSAFAAYSPKARYHAANLAAHNWDVVEIGGRILIACPWSGGHWLNHDCTFEGITPEEYDAFYPVVPYDTSSPERLSAWEQATYDGKIKRQRKIVLPASVDERSQSQDAEERLGPKDASAETAKPADAQTPSSTGAGQ